jgi:hypothetical protein
MSNQSPPDDDKETERRFNEALGRLANTPHKPRKAAKPKPLGPKA